MSKQASRNTENVNAFRNLAPGRGSGFGNRGFRGFGEKPKHFRKTVSRLWEHIRLEKKQLSIIFLLILADSLLMLLGPYLIGVAVNAMSGNGKMVDYAQLEMLLPLLAGIYIIDGMLNFFQGWLMTGAAQKIVKELRSALFAKLQKLPLVYFDTRSHGEVMSRFSNDVDNVSTTISQSVSQLMSGAVAIAGSFIMMMVLSPLLTLAGMITVPLVMVLSRAITKKTGSLFKEQQNQLGKLNANVEETISGLEIIKAFNYEDEAIAEFNEANHRLCAIGIKAQIWSGFLMPLMNVINNIGFAAIAITGGILAVKGAVTVGVIASFFSYSRQFVRPINNLANIFNILQAGVAGAERIFELLDEAEETADVPGKIVLRHPKGHVVFENVSFGYDADVPVLKTVSFAAAAGSCTALVGPTGAGKTTLVNLLTRFYDVTGGRIRIDGLDIRDYTRDSLRKSFGIVLQDTYLFSGTIKENIRYGRPAATDEEIAIAAEMANAAGFIRRLPEQYDTMLSENGSNLSQGQRQLLAIARVILTEPSILILDEATSSIDTRTEAHIQDALLRLMRGRTTFVIAHRLNTIRNADRIMVINDGEIVEAGSHEELLRLQGRYYRMVNGVNGI
jgi:ATP-binding cassette subfamily B protein